MAAAHGNAASNESRKKSNVGEQQGAWGSAQSISAKTPLTHHRLPGKKMLATKKRDRRLRGEWMRSLSAQMFW